MLGTLMQTMGLETQKTLPEVCQNSSLSRSDSIDGHLFLLNSPRPQRKSANRNQTQN